LSVDGSSGVRVYGKHRGKVRNIEDPEKRGRITAEVPSLFGGRETGWAEPSAPYGGKGVGIFFVPPVNANVWIEFEQGNPKLPIWSGCFWTRDEAPEIPDVPAGVQEYPYKVIKTEIATITITDLIKNAGITIETKSGLRISLDNTGIELLNEKAKIKMTNDTVSVNDGALDVT
jgi:hypothetical protein